MTTPDWTNPCGAGEEIKEKHLGGTSTAGDPESWYPELWFWLIKKFRFEKVLDIGCGIGRSQKFFHDYGVKTLGVDGSTKVCEHHLLPEKITCHDFITGPLILTDTFDLVYSSEFLEHVEEKYLSNVLETIKCTCAQMLVLTAAPPGSGGYHHVNLRPKDYWVNHFEKVGYIYMEDFTKKAQAITRPYRYGRKSPRGYFTRGGMIFCSDANSSG